MNRSQQSLIWREWGLAKNWYMTHGVQPERMEETRRKLIERALGYPKSMSDWSKWSNVEVDKVLAAMRGVYDGGNLNAQLQAQEQPERRCGNLRAHCEAVAAQIWPEEIEARNKLRALAWRVCHVDFVRCTDAQLGKVLGILQVQQRRVDERAAKNVAQPTEDSPF